MLVPQVGKVFQNRYLILEELGAGGMGQVYRARQLDAEREVALKVLRSDKANDDESVARFFREFKLLTRLAHPHVMLVYSLALDETTTLPFAVCEYLQGKSLRSLILEEAPLAWNRTISIALQMADSLRYIHENGIVHRDLKPENIVLQDRPNPDFVKLVDFGLSSAFQNQPVEQKLTWTGQLVGTAMYMSPEQAVGKADLRSDIYAFGCVLFEMLSGEPLFIAESSTGAIYKHCNEDPAPRFVVIGNKVPAKLLEVVAGCLRKDPAQRYQNMKDVMLDLRSILADPQTMVHGKTFAAEQDSASHGQATKYFVCAMIVIGLGAFAIISLQKNRVELPAVMNFRSASKGRVPHLEALQKSLAESKNRDADQNPASSLAKVQTLHDNIFARMKETKGTDESRKLEALVPAVLLVLAPREVACNQLERAKRSLAEAREYLQKQNQPELLRDYCLIHSTLYSDPKIVESDLALALSLTKPVSKLDNVRFLTSIIAVNRCIHVGDNASALKFLDAAIEEARTLSADNGWETYDLAVGLAFKASIEKLVSPSSSTTLQEEELRQLVKSENGSPKVLEQIKFVYSIGAFDAAEFMINSSIDALQKPGADKTQILPACIYYLKEVHLRTAKPDKALADCDRLLALFGKGSTLNGIPSKSTIEKERAVILSKL